MKTEVKSEAFREWESLLDPIPKLAVPVDFIKQIVFYYPGDKEIVLDVSEVTDDIRETFEDWVEANYVNAKKISLVVDVEKVRKFIEPITKDFLDSYFQTS